MTDFLGTAGLAVVAIGVMTWIARQLWVRRLEGKERAIAAYSGARQRAEIDREVRRLFARGDGALVAGLAAWGEPPRGVSEACVGQGDQGPAVVLVMRPRGPR